MNALRRQRNVFYFCKAKLIGIDCILPLLMEIRERFNEVNLVVVFPDAFTRENIKRNRHIWKVLTEELGCVFLTLKNREDEEGPLSWFGKLRYLYSLLQIVSRMALNRNVVLKNGDLIRWHRPLMSAIKKISSTVEIYVFTLGLTSEHLILQQIGHDLNRMRLEGGKRRPGFDGGKKSSGPGDYDYFIASNGREVLDQIYGIHVEEGRFLQIGYHRRLSKWLSFVEREAEKLSFRKGEYFVYFLGGVIDQKRYPALEEPKYRELVEESLAVLSKFNDSIKTVFKPHIITDMAVFEDILKHVGYRNYSIDYSHPMILSRGARFVISTNFSTVFFDSYYLGTPVVLYTRYDLELARLLGGRSEGGEACDYFVNRDPVVLEQIVRQLVHEGTKPERRADFLQENYPPTPDSFWRVWERVLGMEVRGTHGREHEVRESGELPYESR